MCSKIFPYLVLFSFIVFFISCDNSQEVPQPTSTSLTTERAHITYGGLKVKMREGHSEKELTMDISDYKQILQSKTGLKSSKITESYSFDYLALLSSKILESYPRIDSVDFDGIKEDFIDLTEEEILANISIIDSFYSSMITFDLINEVSKEKNLKSSKLKSGYLGYELSSEEFWVLAKYPRIISNAKSATSSAINYTNQYFPGYPQYQDIADAFRHSVWSAFLGKAAAPYKNWSSQCCSFAEELTNAHEAGASKPGDMTDEQWNLDKNMDYHNNKIGRDYFYVASYSHKSHWYSNRYVRCPSESEIAAAIYTTYIHGAVKVSHSSEPNSYPSNLVFIK